MYMVVISVNTANKIVFNKYEELNLDWLCNIHLPEVFMKQFLANTFVKCGVRW